MKREIRGFIIGILLTVLLTSNALATSVKQNIEVVFNSINLVVNGEKVEVDNILYNGITYAPVKKIAEMLNKEVAWDNNTRTVNIIHKDNNTDINHNNNSNNNITEKKNVLIEYTPVIKIQDTIYSYGSGNKIYKDNNGEYYTDLQQMAALISISYGDYEIKDNSNPFIDGEIVAKLNDYYKLEETYINIKDIYYEGELFNKDKSKSYMITINKPNADNNLIIYNNRAIVQLHKVFDALNIKYSIDFDEKNNFIIFSFNN